MEQILSNEFNLAPPHAENIVRLIKEGNTIPFIARYRKELTGSCDDQVLREFADRLAYLENLEKRRGEVGAAIAEQGKMTDELALAVAGAATLAELEDVYRPFKQKRKTRASVAKEAGLEPLAKLIFGQNPAEKDIPARAAELISEEKGILTVEGALQGAMDIIAEQLSDDAELRRVLREYVQKTGVLAAKAAKEEDSVFRLYYDFSEAVSKIPSHRILAINRGEKEEFLKVGVELEHEKILTAIERRVLKQPCPATEYVRAAAADAWKRLIFPSLERETRAALTEKATEQAIRMFGLNLKPLLLQPPVRGKVVLGLDPAYRTGCKTAVVDPTGKVLATAVIYPTPPHNKIEEAEKTVRSLIARHGVEVISIGNGTASKETEVFAANLIAKIPEKVSYIVVNEAGASVYSASPLAAKEFPDFDVSLRSAVSIARRLQDPLAELVKIDPKSIGVGQYQHDMPPKQLDETLAGVVEDCVNNVGVDVNTASPSLLSCVAGLSAATAKNICLYREENGAFTARTQLKKVPKLGPRAFEQCAGFLRIAGGKHALDNTGVHPESYEAAGRLLALFGYTQKDIRPGKLAELGQQVKAFGESRAAAECGVGMPTLMDILAELQRPGRDIREDLPAPLLREDLMDIKDLTPGMVCAGTVRNVIDFGVFVDIGVHQDGLVHISRITNRFIKHPSEVLQVGDVVKVKVLEVDVGKKRISLSMKDVEG
ncbi:MAG: RNA-binding transcriptional accessory protein [Oscillospiraceae bacterium]|nr:RNA-binding transcriptional accessory protein [Oscillospiraceae bacterium]